jgi:hypothetical protein
MQLEVSEFLENMAQVIVVNSLELGSGYIAEIYEKATVFCANFGMTADDVAENLNKLLSAPN